MKEIEHRINYDLKACNTLRISSIADDVYFPKTLDEIKLLLANLDNPVIVGNGSNILFSSSGVKRPIFQPLQGLRRQSFPLWPLN